MAVADVEQERPAFPVESATRRESPIDGSLGSPDELRKTVLDCFNESQKFLAPYFSKWLRYYKAYRLYVPAKTRPWRANVVTGIHFADVEHSRAVMMEQWNQRPVIRIFPRGGEDLAIAKTAEEYLQWELDDIPAFLPVHDGTQDLGIYGTGWLKILWDWQADRNTIEAVSPWNLYPDGYAESVDDAEYIVHRSIRSASYVRRMVDAGLYDLQGQDPKDLAKAGLAWTEQADSLLASVGLGSGEFTKNRIEVLELWHEDPKMVVTVLNRRLVVRARRNGFSHQRKPFLRMVDNAVAHELLGIGEIEITERLVDYVHDAESQKFDVVNLGLNNMWGYNRLAGIDPDDLIAQPGGQVGVDGPVAGNIQALVQNLSGVPLTDAEITRLRFYIQEATGIWGFNAGQTPERAETATTVLALQRAGGLRMVGKIRRNEAESFRSLASMMISNAAQLGPKERWVRITGSDEPKRVEMASLQGEWDYEPLMSTAEPKDALRRRFVEILPFLMKHERYNEEAGLNYMADLWDIPKESLMLTPEQWAEKLRMQMMAKMQATGAPMVPGMVPPSAVPSMVPGEDGQSGPPASPDALVPGDVASIAQRMANAVMAGATT